jgi:hypothetical protein
MSSLRMDRVSLALVVLAACGGDDAQTPPPGESRAGRGAEPARDAGAHAPPPARDAGAMDEDEGELVMDRCFGAGCMPSRLPPQPELEFLEDMGDGWQRLMEADWQLAPGSEGYRCMTLTIPEDIYITAFAPQNPVGTHHVTLGVSPEAAAPDEVVACGVGTAGDRKLQGSGAGTESSELPAGVAMPLHRGEQVMMNLHLFNVSEEPLSGRSGMWVKTVPAAEVEHEAEAVLAGPLSLDIPVGRSTQTGDCTLRADATVFALAPHMHQKGVHLRATAVTATEEVTLYDGDYDFFHQLLYDIDDIALRAGDRIKVECTYENDGDQALHWGDSSRDEMCFVGMQLYPAIGYGSFPCSE